MMRRPVIEQHFADLPDILFTRLEPQPVAAPKLIIANDALASLLGIDRDWLHGPDSLQLLAGNVSPPHGKLLAMAYAGHQFGGFSPRLGDGRAALLGDIALSDGTRRELHLKGSGRTLYSRGADGRSTLSAMLREYIVSEAMHALGVPTTRSLAVVATGEDVLRQRPEHGAVLTRVAKSHVRVGTFQFLASRGEVEAVRALMHHEIARSMPEVSGAREFLGETLKRQARLIARWMSFGFIHGVMNTDNAQIAGETIDYGPCAFMDAFDPQKVFSSIDEQGRYGYDQQPMIGLWNMTRFAECLLALLDEDRDVAVKIAEAELSKFMPQFEAEFERLMLAKLGIAEPSQAPFISKTLQQMTNTQADFTRFFAALTRGDDLRTFFISQHAHDEWLAEWITLRGPNAKALMQTHNPVYIARNHRVEEALAAAEIENYLPLHQLLSVIQKPFETRAEFEVYENAPSAQEEVLKTFCGT